MDTLELVFGGKFSLSSFAYFIEKNWDFSSSSISSSIRSEGGKAQSRRPLH